jgi:predicted  nucleic acid-binding Zn-ribbon protein
MSSDLSGVYRRLYEISKKIDDLKTTTEDLAKNIDNVRQIVIDTRKEVLEAVENSKNELLVALTALESAVADLKNYVENQFNELRDVIKKYREEFLAEHEKRHRESVALSTYQQDFLKNLDIAMLGIRARIEEISQALKELEDKTRRIDTRLFEYSLHLATERVEIK